MFKRIRTWLASWVTDAPAGDLGSLDVRNGLDRDRGHYPAGEIPYLPAEDADRLWASMTGAPFADWDEHMDNTINDLDEEWDR